ncbi:MAG: adenylate/guanylate cyclase domain-containing protein [Candidatus Rifleibacteriota bacterium]
MKRRIKMVLPLIFAFVLTLMPYLLLEFTQFQRNSVQQERNLYLWEQKANNYLQFFSILWSYELQLKRRMMVFRRNQGDKIIKSNDPAKAFAAELKKRFPESWLPLVSYAGICDSDGENFKLFKGDLFGNSQRFVFKTILSALAGDSEPQGYQKKQLDTFVSGRLKNDLNFDLIKKYRRGKICYVKYKKQNRLMIWDKIQNGNKKIVYCCFFKNELLSVDESLKLALKMLSGPFPDVDAALVPVENRLPDYDPVTIDNFGSQRVMSELLLKEQEGVSRKELLPVGKVVKHSDSNVIRGFVASRIPYEIWLFKPPEKKIVNEAEKFIFLFRLGFFSIWLLFFTRVLITAKPLGLSISGWLSFIFIAIGILPLIVLYIAGTYHLESSAFRYEQQTLKNIIRQFEEADVSGGSILTEFRRLCRKIESRPFWKKALVKWDPQEWKKALKKVPELFAKSGLELSFCCIYPPPVAELEIPYYDSGFGKKLSKRDKHLASFYYNWVMKSYFNLNPDLTFGKDFQMEFFEGKEGEEILRLFMGNRADSDYFEMGNQRQFFYQNFIMKDGMIRNWYFFKADVVAPFRNYLKAKVTDWNDINKNTNFGLAKVDYPDSKTILPKSTGNNRDFIRLNNHASHLIELAASTNSRIFKQNENTMVVVYPCRKSGNFILAAVIAFRDMHERIRTQSYILALILILLTIPVFFISRFIATYLVRPLKAVEAGLTRVADQNFTSRISLNRQDELGTLADAFDKMVDGIIERHNLGRFVSAGLDNKIASEDNVIANQWEKNYAAVLCLDIRGFTTLSEKYLVRDIVSMLNEHLSEMALCITKSGGLIEQFIGDAILAVFPGEDEKQAANKAIRAAMRMMAAHNKLVEKRNNEGKFVYKVGIGIEVGQIVSGVVQLGDKSEYVMIGTSRSRSEELESQSKQGRASRIICSEKVKNLTDDYSFIKLPDGDGWEIVLPEDQEV